MNIKFISYDGKYPNLCAGTLIFTLDEKIYTIEPHSLISGGIASVNGKGHEKVKHGPWGIDIEDFPEEIRMYEEEILDMINSNIKYGCCGGCI